MATIDKKKLKELVKDEKCYKKLLSLLEESDPVLKDSAEIITQMKEGFSNFFWYVKNAETNEFIFYSDSVEKITGYSYSDLITMPGGILSLVHEDDLPSVKAVFAELMSEDNDEAVQFDYRSLTKAGDIIWFRSTVYTDRDENGKVINLKGVTFDITEFKENEIILEREKQRLADLNNSKDKFISIVSHDLRSPFTSLLGFSEILLHENELTDHEKNEYLEYIYEASKTQLQMINYLLDWSKLQTGKLNIELSRVNLKGMLSNCVSVLTGAAIRKNIEIHMEADPNIFIYADERLTSQSISNLLSNAIKFTPNGKQVSLSANRFKEGMVEIIVKDEGVGISEKNQAKMFRIDEKFSLLGTNGEKGSGLGLTLVKEIIGKHGGQIWFYSQENEGSEFHITLPEAKNIVLIVENNPKQKEDILNIVKNDFPGHKIVTAENGYEAISKLAHTIPTLIITAHDMPLMKGNQLINTIRQKFSHNPIPVIVLHEDTQKNVKEEYKNLGVDLFVKKPISNSKLMEVIKQVVF